MSTPITPEISLHLHNVFRIVCAIDNSREALATVTQKHLDVIKIMDTANEALEKLRKIRQQCALDNAMLGYDRYSCEYRDAVESNGRVVEGEMWQKYLTDYRDYNVGMITYWEEQIALFKVKLDKMKRS